MQSLGHWIFNASRSSVHPSFDSQDSDDHAVEGLASGGAIEYVVVAFKGFLFHSICKI